MGYSLQYYDLILLAILVSLILGFSVGLVTPLPIFLSVIVMALVGVGLIAHALFIRGPVSEFDDLTEEVEPEDVPGAATLISIVK